MKSCGTCKWWKLHPDDGWVPANSKDAKRCEFPKRPAWASTLCGNNITHRNSGKDCLTWERKDDESS